jgi:hypothetical protein
MSKTWTRTKPTAADVGKWFVMRLNADTNKDCWFVEIRQDEQNRELYVCHPCNSGIQKTSYGNPLNLYSPYTEFWGPIDMPADYRGVAGVTPQCRSRKEQQSQQNS